MRVASITSRFDSEDSRRGPAAVLGACSAALVVSGIVSVLFGLVVLIAPGAGALGLVWAIAAYSVVFGISFIALSLRLRSHRHEPAAA